MAYKGAQGVNASHLWQVHMVSTPVFLILLLPLLVQGAPTIHSGTGYQAVLPWPPDNRPASHSPLPPLNAIGNHKFDGPIQLPPINSRLPSINTIGNHQLDGPIQLPPINTGLGNHQFDGPVRPPPINTVSSINHGPDTVAPINHEPDVRNTVPPMNTEPHSSLINRVDKFLRVVLLEPGSKYGIIRHSIDTIIQPDDYYRLPWNGVIASPEGQPLSDEVVRPGQIVRIRGAKIAESRLNELMASHWHLDVYIPMLLPARVSRLIDRSLKTVLLPPHSTYNDPYRAPSLKVIPENRYIDVPRTAIVTTPLGECPQASGNVVRIIDAPTLKDIEVKCHRNYHSELARLSLHQPGEGYEARYVEFCKESIFKRLAARRSRVLPSLTAFLHPDSVQ